ncbi:hypothetical protein DXA15_17860 [Parabacteroides sp. AM58-2XD]|uniref:hypothetical protein n=2 Tax=Bacteroidia TaxID=200643 RepID=UPI000FE1E25E|nr:MULTISPECIES: hypothetical protein [Parabacteroides]MCM0719910.1 hypothetical protein [Parabacteroides sp. W1-Q-101]RGY94514.1 hypothetical protein DXA15_17860 [Parabacteroides sp. AM58-2XD]GKG74018.1 hypothetical protein CE91St1_31610 [Parabacteroides goldsteinii]GKG82575.1 hypothetical protein CE91St2_57670 [Parabacteroides goldsteinii]
MKTVSLFSFVMMIFVMMSCEKEAFDSMSLGISSNIPKEYQVRRADKDTLDIEFISMLVPDFERTVDFSVELPDKDSENICNFIHKNLVIPANTEKFNNKLIIDNKMLSEKKKVLLHIGMKGKGAFVLNTIELTIIPLQTEE